MSTIRTQPGVLDSARVMFLVAIIVALKLNGLNEVAMHSSVHTLLK